MQCIDVDLDMKENEVDEIVLVGGTTRIPKIKEQLRYELDYMKLNK